MELKEIGKTQVKLAPITFGVWTMGANGGADKKEVEKAINQAYDLGLTSFDTAPGYGLGLSESVLAKAIEGKPRDKIQILTKCGIRWDNNQGAFSHSCEFMGKSFKVYRNAKPESIIHECEQSLKRLKIEYIDLYSIHWPDPTTPIQDSMEALRKLIDQGKIKAAGLCNHTLTELETANQDTNVAAIKVRYSMLNRGIEKSLIPYCSANNISILAYSVLQRGILTGKELPQFLWDSGDNPLEVALYKPENLKKIKAFLGSLQEIAYGYGVDCTRLCINWTLERFGIAVALLGATSPEQIKYDAKALDFKLVDKDIELINNLITDLEQVLQLVSENN